MLAPERSAMLGLLAALGVGCAAAPPPRSGAAPTVSQVAASSGSAEVRLEVGRWRVIERESGPDNYYALVTRSDPPFIRAEYRPPYRTAVLGYELDEATREKAVRLRWKWRAVTLPQGGDECTAGKGDSAAVIYVTWRRGLRYYSLKYVWSAVGRKGAVCDQKRNPFVAQDTVILETGPADGAWKSEEIELRTEFLRHFAEGDPEAEVPAFLGVGIMTDGDQTESPSAADYSDFVIVTANEALPAKGRR